MLCLQSEIEYFVLALPIGGLYSISAMESVDESDCIPLSESVQPIDVFKHIK